MKIKKPKITKSGIEAEEVEFTNGTFTIFLTFISIGIGLWAWLNFGG